MNELIVKEQKDTITSLELVEQINIFRVQEGNRKALQHKDLLKVIRDEFEEEINGGKISPVEYKDKKGELRPMFELTLNQAKQVLMRESKFVRKAMIHYIEELENKLKPKLPTTYLEALKELVAKEEALLLANQTIKEQQPKVEYHDKVLNSESCYTTTQIAKELEMSARQLNIMLNHMGVQFKQSGQWMLTAKYQDNGYTKIRTHLLPNGDTKHSTVWTEKGRKFLLDLSEDF